MLVTVLRQTPLPSLPLSPTALPLLSSTQLTNTRIQLSMLEKNVTIKPGLGQVKQNIFKRQH